MKKIKLFMFILALFISMPYVYAESIVESVSDINNVPVLSGRKTIYITDTKDFKININDTDNFKIINDNEIVIYNKPTKDTSYENPFSLTYNNAGYYINDAGDTVKINVIISATKIMLDTPNESYTDSADHYTIGEVHDKGFEAKMYARNKSNSNVNIDPYVGNHMYLSFKIINADGTELPASIANNLAVPWTIYDLDIRDKSAGAVGNGFTSANVYRESIQFNTGFNNKFYVLDKTVLDISENNTKYSATQNTGNDLGATGQKGYEYSTVVAYQTAKNTTFEWWGTGCGTFINTRANSYDYPEYPNPVKSVSKEYYNIGDTVNYTVTQKFPYTIAENKATKIELIDEFDNALDISNITYKVTDANSKDVTSNWKKNISGQKITLTYTGSDTTQVVGLYNFTFNNLKILEPDNTHKSVTENKIYYKIIPNKANVKITSINNNEENKETNIVNIKVPYSGLLLKKTVTISELNNPKAGDIVNYKFTISNLGDTKLTDVKLSDEMNGIVIDSGMKNTLESKETIEVYGHYVLLESDIKSGKVLKNTATVTGIDPSGTILSSTDTAVVEIIVNPQTGTTSRIILVIELLIIAFSFAILLFKRNFLVNSK